MSVRPIEPKAASLQPLAAGRASGSGLQPRNAVLLFIAAVGLSLAIAVLGVWHQPPVAQVDDLLLDTFERAFASGAPAHDAVVVDVDDASLAAVGQWPWPRYRVASLIQRIASGKPAAIGLDITFPEDDRVSLNQIQQTYKRDFGLDISFSGLPDGMLDNDGYLGQTLGRQDVVAASYFYFDHATQSAAAPRPGIGFDGRTDLLELPDAPGVMTNAAAIAAQTRTSGFINVRLDSDATLRRMPLLLRHGGVLHPSLALATTMRALGLRQARIESDSDGLAIQVGSHRVPIDAQGRTVLRFDGGSSAYASLSAVDVLNGDFRPEDLRGKIVYIGTSAAGLNDFHKTAVAPLFPGLKTHAVMTQDILQDRLLATPAWSSAVVAASCASLAMLLAGAFLAGSGVAPFVAASVLSAVLVTAAAATLYARAGLLVPVGAPLSVIAVLFASFFALRVALEKRRARLWSRRLENARQVTIESMASVAETRDPETGAHIKRTQRYVRAIAEELKRSGHYPNILTREFIDLLFISAPLHDIGKVGVPDRILLKPARLTDEEMEVMKQHAEFGRRIVLSTAEHIEGDNFLVIAAEIAGSHHEKWDGNGYPAGLAGQAIPLSGRIMAVADVYDALISRRCYKEAFTHAHSTTLMRAMNGTTFDPSVLEAFFRIEREIIAIANDFRDETPVGDELAPDTVPVSAHGIGSPSSTVPGSTAVSASHSSSSSTAAIAIDCVDAQR